ALLRPTTKNPVDAPGHFVQTPRLPAYLPGNGGTLIAVALMTAGWDSGPPAPGLPARFGVRPEGLLPLPASPGGAEGRSAAAPCPRPLRCIGEHRRRPQ